MQYTKICDYALATNNLNQPSETLSVEGRLNGREYLEVDRMGVKIVRLRRTEAVAEY